MLAKKLLTSANEAAAEMPPVAHESGLRREKTWGEDPLVRMSARGYNKKNYFGFEKFPLEEKKFLPIIILAAHQMRVDLWKRICPRVRQNFGNKFTLPTLVIRNYVLEP